MGPRLPDGAPEAPVGVPRGQAGRAAVDDGPSGTIPGLVLVQAFLPIAGTSWTALVTGTVGHPDHADLLDLLDRRMAGSLRVQRQPPERRLQ